MVFGEYAEKHGVVFVLIAKNDCNPKILPPILKNVGFAVFGLLLY